MPPATSGNRRPPLSFPAAFFTAVLLAGCGEKDQGAAPDTGFPPTATPRVFAVNYPLAYFAERIGGRAVEVVFPADPGVDPAFWKPSAEAIAEFQSADLILKNGADYAKWIRTTSLPDSIVVDTSRAFSDSLIEIHDAGSHQHGDSGEHSHGGVALTTWLDLAQAIQQAAAVRDALIRHFPERRETFETNYPLLQRDLESLDGELALVAVTLSETPLVASHPVYQYAARRYGLRIRSLLWQAETVPDDEAMQELANLLEKHPAKVMIWERPPDEASVKKLAEIGVSSIVFDPAANRPASGEDLLDVMQSNIEALEKVAESTD